MLNVLCVLLIGFMLGAALMVALCEWFYRRRLQNLEDHWSTTYNRLNTEWTDFYKAEAKRWQEHTSNLVEQAAQDAAQATDDLWRGKKSEKKSKPSN